MRTLSFLLNKCKTVNKYKTSFMCIVLVLIVLVIFLRSLLCHFSNVVYVLPSVNLVFFTNTQSHMLSTFPFAPLPNTPHTHTLMHTLYSISKENVFPLHFLHCSLQWLYDFLVAAFVTKKTAGCTQVTTARMRSPRGKYRQ